MDHVPAGQVIATGDAGLAGGAAVQRFALGHEARPGDPVDGTVYPGAAQQGGVGGVDDGISVELGDVTLYDGEIHDGLLR